MSAGDLQDPAAPQVGQGNDEPVKAHETCGVEAHALGEIAAEGLQTAVLVHDRGPQVPLHDDDVVDPADELSVEAVLPSVPTA